MGNNYDVKKPKILITEDDFENQRFLEMFLKKNFDVEMCDSDQTFYEHLKKTKFDVILMDISLRGNKNGLELTKELKQIPGYENIPIVCLTAHTFKKDRDSALEAGVNVFLTKPVENHILMETLLGVLNK
ncbi:MAG TPA: response regulator [Ignavibacteriaceae bacterium]|nr:response regulator [Ignavibacteriaceae bacterium]